MNKITCSRVFHFCAGHRVFGHENKCAHLHGHNYRVEITAEAPNLDSVGRVVDFSELKVLGRWIEDNWDHGFLYAAGDEEVHNLLQTFQPKQGLAQKRFVLTYNPTAENLARYLLDVVCPRLFAGQIFRINSVTIWETVNCYATAQLSN